MGKSGGCASSQAEAMGRLISLGLRSNLAPDMIIKQLKGVSCHQPSWQSGGRILSCADAIAKCLEQYTPIARQAAIERKAMAAGNGGGIAKPSDEIMLIGMCPECGGTVEHEGGCAVCHNCGFTKCG
jgi:ribonucleoside-diphosphate reductase alpha chain